MRLPGTEDVSSRTDLIGVRDIARGLRPEEAALTQKQTPENALGVDDTNDVVSVSSQALVMQQFQQIVQQLNVADDSQTLGDALRSLKAFVAEQAKPGMLGNVLEQVADMADRLMTQMVENPDQKFMGLQVAADFSKQQLNSEVMVYETVTFNFQLRAMTEEGTLSVNMSMTQSSQRTENFMQFLSKETAMISYNGKISGLSSNPLLSEFGALADMLLKQVEPLLLGSQTAIMSYEELMRLMEKSGSSDNKLKLLMLDQLVSAPQKEEQKDRWTQPKTLLEIINPEENKTIIPAG